MLIVRAARDESGQIPDEQVVKLAFVVGNRQQVDMMFPLAMFRSLEWEDFVVFKIKTLTLMDGFKFSNLDVSENLKGNWSPVMTSLLKYFRYGKTLFALLLGTSLYIRPRMGHIKQ